MAKVRVIIDFEVDAQELMHREVWLIANSIGKSIAGSQAEEPEWFSKFCKNAKFSPKTARVWSVERLLDDAKAPEIPLESISNEIEK